MVKMIKHLSILLVLIVACCQTEVEGVFGIFKGKEKQTKQPEVLTGGKKLDQLLYHRKPEGDIDFDGVFKLLRDISKNLEFFSSSDELGKATIKEFLELEKYYMRSLNGFCNPEVAQALLDTKHLFPQDADEATAEFKKKQGKNSKGLSKKVGYPITVYIYETIHDRFRVACKRDFVEQFSSLDRFTDRISEEELLKNLAVGTVIYGDIIKSRVAEKQIPRSKNGPTPEFLSVLGHQEITESDLGYMLRYIKKEAFARLNFELMSLFMKDVGRIRDKPWRLCQAIKSKFFTACEHFGETYGRVLEPFKPMADKIGELNIKLDDNFCNAYAKYKMCDILRQDNKICDKVKHIVETSAEQIFDREPIDISDDETSGDEDSDEDETSK